MIKQEHTQRHTIDEEAVIDSLAHRNAPRRRKWDLETVSEIWNRPKYAGGGNDTVPLLERPKAEEGTKATTTNSKPRFRKNVEIPGLSMPNWNDLDLTNFKERDYPDWKSAYTMYNYSMGHYFPKATDSDKSEFKKRFTPNTYDDSKQGMAQNTFLMNREAQRKAMENKGYVYKGNSDEEYDKTFVTDRAKKLSKYKGYNIPVYQTQPDEVHEETWSLIPKDYKGKSFFNLIDDRSDMPFYENPDAAIRNGGTYPAHFRTDSKGRIYLQADDVNDYDTGVPGFRNVLNQMGHPMIVTTGPRRISTYGMDYLLGNMHKPYGIDFRGKESPLVAYLKDPSHNLVLMSERYPRVGYSTNETVVTTHGNYTKPKQWNHSRMRLGGRNTILEHSKHY